MKFYSILLSIILLTGCSTKPKQQKTEKKQVSVATLFADAVMQHSDSLIYYLTDRPKYEYDFSFLGSAIDKLGNTDKKYSDYMKAYIDYFVQEDGSITGYKLTDYNLDRIRPGFNMLELYQRTGNEKYKKAIETLVSQVENQPRVHSGGFWHKKIYPFQMWLDGIYMASPFLARFAKDFNQPRWFDEVTFQIQEI